MLINYLTEYLGCSKYLVNINYYVLIEKCIIPINLWSHDIISMLCLPTFQQMAWCVYLFIFGHAGSSLQRTQFFVAALGLSCTMSCRLLVPLPGIEPSYSALKVNSFLFLNRVDNLIRWKKDLVYKTVWQNYSWSSFSLHCRKANFQTRSPYIFLFFFFKCFP